MTKQEALALLADAVEDDQPSKVNPTLTRRKAVEIMRNGVGQLDAAWMGPDNPRRILTERNVRRVAADRGRKYV